MIWSILAKTCSDENRRAAGPALTNRSTTTGSSTSTNTAKKKIGHPRNVDFAAFKGFH